MAYLVIEGPDGRTQRVTLAPGKTTLGRDPQCDVHLDDRLVSRRHVSVSPGFIVEDLDSFNGVFVRGKRIQRAFLLPGEGFRIGSKGKYEVRVLSEEALAGSGPVGDSGMTMAESQVLPPGAAAPPGSRPYILDDSEVQDRLRALQEETQRLARENEELRQRLSSGTTNGAAPRQGPAASAEAAASSSHTMSFEPRARTPSSDRDPREET